jgi:hypothetical protein
MHPAFVVGISSFAFSVVGALLGVLIGRGLPPEHVSEGSKDVIRIAVTVVATLAALVASLLLSAAKGSFEIKDNELKQAATQIILLDRTMAEYGSETHDARALLRDTVAGTIEAVWSDLGRGAVNPDAIKMGSELIPLQQFLLKLDPTSDTQRWLKSSALEANRDIEKARLHILQEKDGSIPYPFLSILVLWFAIIFLSFGLYAPRNATVLFVLFTCALCVASALFLIVQLDRPYGGFIQIKSTPLQIALEQIGK